jgi:hypothetical protein
MLQRVNKVLVKYTFFEAEFGKLPATQLEKAKN